MNMINEYLKTTFGELTFKTIEEHRGELLGLLGGGKVKILLIN